MSKDKIMRIIVVITSFFAGAAYFIKYLVPAGIGKLGGDMFEEALDVVGPIILIPLCAIPIVLLVLSIVFNIVTLAANKLMKTSTVFGIVSSVFVFLSAIIIKPTIYFLSVMSIKTGFIWWVQMACVITCLVLSSILCHWIRKGKIGQNGTTPLSPKDVAIIGLRGGAGGQVFMLNDDERVSVGRDPQQCNIIVPGSSANVSRKHCVIHYDFDRSAYMVMDTSSNGTFVYENGQKKRLPLGVEVPVSAGNVIMLGDELTTFRLN